MHAEGVVAIIAVVLLLFWGFYEKWRRAQATTLAKALYASRRANIADSPVAFGVEAGLLKSQDQSVEVLTAALEEARAEADRQRTRADGFFGIIERSAAQATLAWELYSESAHKNAAAQAWLFRELQRHSKKSGMPIEPKLAALVGLYPVEHPRKKPPPEVAVRAWNEIASGRREAGLELLEKNPAGTESSLKEDSTEAPRDEPA